MIYNFKAEDRNYYEILDILGILPYLQLFLYQNENFIKDSLKNIIEEMKKEENSGFKSKFISEIDLDELLEVVNFTFIVIFSKDLTASMERGAEPVISILSARSLAIKMSIDTQNPSYIENLEKVIKICSTSILTSYRAEQQ